MLMGQNQRFDLEYFFLSEAQKCKTDLKGLSENLKKIHNSVSLMGATNTFGFLV